MRTPSDDSFVGDDDIPFPLAPDVWERIAKEMKLSDRQQTIVELLLRRKRCNQVGPVIGIGHPTVETQLKRIYQRCGVRDHTELLLHIMALSQQPPENGACHV